MRLITFKSFNFLYITLAIALLASILGYAWHNVSERGLHKPAGAHGAAKTPLEVEKGPHGGKLLRDGDFALEVKIFETGVEPQLRLYAFVKDKPLLPNHVTAAVTVKRLDALEQLNFKPEADYLLADQIIYEPHSFEMLIQATHANKTHHLKWTQLEGRIQLAQESIISSGIKLLSVAKQPFQGQLNVTGEIQIPIDQQVAVTARSAGVITKVTKTLGARVKAGEVLAVMESRDLLSLRATQRSAKQQLSLAHSTLKREERLWREKVSPEQDYLNAKAIYDDAAIRYSEATQMIKSLGGISTTNANNLDAKSYIRAPISGTIIDLKAQPGQSVSPDTMLFQVADTSELIALVHIPEQSIAQVKTGMATNIQAASNQQSLGGAAGLSAQGTVAYISAVLDNDTRTAPAHIRFKNPSQQWRQGQLIKAYVGVGDNKMLLAVRDDALQTFRDWTVVYIRVADQFEVRPVTLGQSFNGYSEVISGLKQGQVYAAGNSYLLKAELGKAGASHDH